MGRSTDPSRIAQARSASRSIHCREMRDQAAGAPSPQGWRIILRNYVHQIGAMDPFAIPTVTFELLYVFIIVGLARRELVCVNVTPHPTAEWIARQITEAFPCREAPRYLIRDRDQIYGTIVTRHLRAVGIRDKPIAPPAHSECLPILSEYAASIASRPVSRSEPD